MSPRQPKPTPVVLPGDVWTSSDPREPPGKATYRLVSGTLPNGKVSVSDPISRRTVLPIQIKRFVPNSTGYKLVCRVGDVYEGTNKQLRYEGRHLSNTDIAILRPTTPENAPTMVMMYVDVVTLKLVTRGTGKVE